MPLFGSPRFPDSTRLIVADFERAYGKRPNLIALGGYDGMHLIIEALKKTRGKTDGDTMIAAMKGLKWESPRGPMRDRSADPGRGSK